MFRSLIEVKFWIFQKTHSFLFCQIYILFLAPAPAPVPAKQPKSNGASLGGGVNGNAAPAASSSTNGALQPLMQQVIENRK